MPDERVVIHIEVNSDDRAIDRTRRRLERLAGARSRDSRARRRADRDEGLASRASSRALRRGQDEFNKVSRGYKKRFDSFDKMIRGMGMGLQKFLSLSIKGVILEMAAMGAAMMAIHLLFASGAFLMKTYRGMMKMVASGMAGVAIAAATVAAALREQQAAMYAFTGRGQAKEFGSSLNQTRVQMRALTMDADLAAVGVENLVAVYGEVSKTSKFTTASRQTLKGLMDFASAGMDIKKGTEQAGQLISTLQDTKKSYSEVVDAGKKFSPQMKKALEAYEKDAGKEGKTKEALTAAIRSGELAKLGGVDGQFAAVSGTLISTLKGQLNMLRGTFADFGQQFIRPIKKEAHEVFGIITTAVKRLSGLIAEYGNSGFIDKISDTVDKIAEFVTKTLRDFLPGSVGIFTRIAEWWENFTKGWERMAKALEPFIEGARVVEGILKQAWLPVFDQIQEKMYSFNNELLANEPELLDFGKNIGELLAKVMEYFSEARKLFFEALPFINQVIKGFTQLVELFTSFLGGFMKLTGGTGLGGVGSFMMLMGLAKGMKNTKGYFTRTQSMSGIREVANMNIRADVIYINGRPIAQYGPKGVGGSSGLVKGSNQIRTGPSTTTHRGPYMVPPGRGAGAGAGAGAGLASRGSGAGVASRGGGTRITPDERRRLRQTYGGNVRQNAGPNGGHLITSGPNRGQEILTQRVRGRNVEYMFGGRGTGPANTSAQRVGIEKRSGVRVDPSQRVGRGRYKTVDATGRIITRREQLARAIGEGQRHGATGFASDGRPKNIMDRIFGGNRGAGGFIGRAADRYRDRLIRKSKYLGPEGPPINPRTGRPYGRGTKAYKAWQLTSTAAYGPGTYDPNSLTGRFKNSRFYNNFLAPNTALAGPMQRGMSKLNVARHIQNMRLFAGESRKSRLGAMMLGNENRKGFQGSATGTMGTMLGLGLLAESGMVSEEAKGFLSAGAMVGMMNPLAGLAIGLGGTALTAKTVAGGAVAGAGAGAAIGSMIAPGFGTAAGAIIGAAVGGIMGRVNKIKEEKKQAKEAFEAVFDRIITDNLTIIQREMMASGGVGKSQIAKAASKGGRIAQQQDVILDMFRSGASGTEITDYLTKNSQLYGLTPDDVKKMKKRPEETVKVIKKVEERQTAMNALTDIYSKRLKELTMMTGKSEQEVELLAMELGVNLYDATADFNDIVQKLGVSVVQTREQLKGMQMDIALKGLEDFKKKMALVADPEIIDEQARSFRDLYDSVDGNISDSEFSEFLYSFTPNMFNYVGGALQGLIEIRRMFGMNGSEFGRKEGDITSPFFGMEKLFQSSPVGVAYQDMVDKQIEEGARGYASQVNARLFQSKSTGRFQIDANKLGVAISGLDPDAAKQLISDIEAGTLFNQVDIDTLTRDQFVSMLGKYGIRESQLGIRAVQDNDALTISLDALPDELRTTYTAIIDMFGAFFDTRDSTKPEWMTDEFIKFVAANQDTSSPRGKGIGDTTASRLSQTMGRHAALDGALTGNRTVTSAYRTYGLGSINSDHVTGRAYDLVGQNLGSYQRLVRDSGGFAEFHGRNAGRHLHVVPGPGPYGDAVSPRIMAPVATPSGESGGGNGITISQVIYGNTNASEIADQAVRKMKLALENERQRR